MKSRTVVKWFVAAFIVTCGGGEALSQTDFWQKTNPPFGHTVSSVASSASSGIIVGTDSGVFRSTDNGETWTQSNSGLNPGVGYIVFSSKGTILAWGNGGYYRTTDNGSNWTEFTHAGGPDFRTAVAINDSGYIFGGWGNEVGGGVERSTDNGVSWKNTGLVANSYALVINATGNIFSGGWYSGGACVFRSTDNGSSWINTGSFGLYYPVNALAISAAGHIFAGTSSDGVFHSTDNGAHWIPSDSGMRASFVTKLAINSSGHIFAGTYSEGVYRSTDDGATWTTINSGLTNDTVSSIAINTSGTIFVATLNGLYRSVESTTSLPTAGLKLWLRADAGVDTLNGTVGRWHDQSGNGNDAIQATVSRQPLLVAAALNGKPVLRFDGLNDKLGFTGTTPMTQFSLFLVINNHSGTAHNTGNVITFGANGDFNNQWFMGMQNISGPDTIGMLGNNAWIVAVRPGLAAYDQWRNLNVVANQSIWSTRLRWDGSDAQMYPGGSGPAFSVPMGDANGSGGGIGGADGVPDGTILAKCDVAEVIVYDVALTDSVRNTIESYLAAKYGLQPTNSVGDPLAENLPEKFVLEQNYPNPFNPSTTIRYGLPQTSVVMLTIFNVIGQHVATLVQGQQEAGNHEVRFDGSSLASGVYIYRLQAGAYVQTKKLMLLR